MLMALSPYKYPPVKSESFYRAMKLAGWDSLYRTKRVDERYAMSQKFMDSIIAQSESFQVEMDDRLDVQGVVWCVSGGWKKIPIPSDWVNDPNKRVQTEQEEFHKDLLDLEAESSSDGLTPTEKLALVKARRGQGKFRENLLMYWDCCAVTGCQTLSLLRASHIKPWRLCDNQQRLDRFNGVLLSPNLDSAFDKGLITFEDSGQIKISELLTTDDRKALGIHRRLRLCKTSTRHLPYLKFHREEVFEKFL